MRSPTWAAPWIFFGAFACSRDGTTARRASDVIATVTAEQLVEKVRDQKARAVLVNAWATWCDSCQHELPMLQGLADRLASRGFRVLLVSVDEPETQGEVPTFLATNAVKLPTYFAARPLGTFKAGLDPRWPGMLPASFLFDGAGKVRYFWGGEAFENELLPVVEGLLSGKTIDGESRFDLAPGADKLH